MTCSYAPRFQVFWRSLCASSVLCSMALGAVASSADELRAVEVVKRYSAAYVRGDVDEVVRLSHPVLFIREGGREQFNKVLAETFQQFAAVGAKGSPETIGTASDEFVNGKTRMFGVPMIRKLPGRNVAAVYVAVSYDAGHTWAVLGLSCTDERWLAAVAPGYKGVPDILGVANPETAKLLEGKPIDDAVFLQGPKAAKRN